MLLTKQAARGHRRARDWIASGDGRIQTFVLEIR
jgi:hypothetical protein